VCFDLLLVLLLGACAGLGARAMNLPISIDESNAGLVPPAVATVLMGAGGGFLLVFQVSHQP
jgi:hypothetical protein